MTNIIAFGSESKLKSKVLKGIVKSMNNHRISVGDISCFSSVLPVSLSKSKRVVCSKLPEKF